MLQRPTKPHTLSARFTRWLNHIQILSEKSGHYKNPARAGTLSKMRSVFSQRFLSQGNRHELSRMVRLFKQELRLILPHPDNNSYRSSTDELEQIIIQAEQG